MIEPTKRQRITRRVEAPGNALDRAIIRRAIKPFQCDGWAHESGHATIAKGDFYIEGDRQHDRAGGWGALKYCLACCFVALGPRGATR